MAYPTTNLEDKRMMHHRKIDIVGYQLADQSYEIEGNLYDVRGHDMNLQDRGGHFPAHSPLHVMTLRLWITHEMLISRAEALTHASPFHLCKAVNKNYLNLQGVTIGAGWNQHIKARLGHEKGCTHLNELLAQMATVAFQTVWGSQENAEASLDARMINSCYGYQENGDVVLRYQKNKTIKN